MNLAWNEWNSMVYHRDLWTQLSQHRHVLWQRCTYRSTVAISAEDPAENRLAEDLFLRPGYALLVSLLLWTPEMRALVNERINLFDCWD